ncbi:hypothetical protein CBR_g37129 [Chara braunii]|uniref:Zeta-carotene desaturase n=1 Tax=Chara braunii TaxID=69332 RepID=A0A388LMF2_CHABU|nr:hypothetical protein CBR_g37129 [Chara braunii]|eukprot:GBG83415.1 hypothetical protein CBR_g37129 [Chara braunii]
MAMAASMSVAGTAVPAAYVEAGTWGKSSTTLDTCSLLSCRRQSVPGACMDAAGRGSRERGLAAWMGSRRCPDCFYWSMSSSVVGRRGSRSRLGARLGSAAAGAAAEQFLSGQRLVLDPKKEEEEGGFVPTGSDVGCAPRQQRRRSRMMVRRVVRAGLREVQRQREEQQEEDSAAAGENGSWGGEIFQSTSSSSIDRASLATMVSNMRRKAPKGLFPPEPAKYNGPKLRVAIVGSGLAGMSTAVELLDQGHEVDIFEGRPFIGGKVASYKDKNGNHVEMGLHVFFGCYNNLFRLMNKVGGDRNLLLKDHTHTFINRGGGVGELDFRFFTGAPLHGIKAFLSTNQLSFGDKVQNSLALATSPIVRALVDPEGAMQDIRDLDKVSFTEWFLGQGGSRGSIDRMWNPVAYALGFIDCDNISARCMLTIFAFFATKTEASVLRMLKGSPDNGLSGPIRKYIEDRGGRFHVRWGCREILYEEQLDGSAVVTGLVVGKSTEKKVVKADCYVAACDIPGIQRLLPKRWREWEFFDNIYKLSGVPVVTVQLRYDGWVTEMQDIQRSRNSKSAVGIDNLLYSADADFSCFADLALTSPEDYYKEGEGSLLQCVITPGDPYMPLSNEEIVRRVNEQVFKLFPSSRGLNLTWSSVVKIAQSLYREAPGMDLFRPDQSTPVPNFFLSGSYTKQDYIDSMEGATLSGRQASTKICQAGQLLYDLSQSLTAKAAQQQEQQISGESDQQLQHQKEEDEEELLTFV